MQYALEFIYSVKRLSKLMSTKLIRRNSNRRIDVMSARLACTVFLVVPAFKLSTIGSRTCKVAAAQTWYGQLEDITSSPSLSAFHNRIKTHFVS